MVPAVSNNRFAKQTEAEPAEPCRGSGLQHPFLANADEGLGGRGGSAGAAPRLLIRSDAHPLRRFGSTQRNFALKMDAEAVP